MARQEKNKPGFVIKLSSETVQKLAEEEELKKSIEKTSTDTTLTDSESSQAEINTVDASSDEIIETKNVTDSTDNKHKAKLKKFLEDRELSKSDKTNTLPNSDSANSKWGEYSPYITYEGDVAVYTDPNTNQKYTWCSSTNSWVLKSSEDTPLDIPGRVYSYENDTHIYTDSDGSKYFYDLEKKAWIPKVDDDFLAYYQMSYGFVDNTVKVDNNDKKDRETQSQGKPESSGVKRKADPQWFDASETNNTKVYVSNLPLDITEEEFVDLMQKCGLVMRDPNTQKMKVKLYMDKEQNCFKGDALCTYIKIESVELALKILDGLDYKGNKIKVERAHFQLKGEYNPALKPKKKKKKELEKLKRMQEKLFDWRPEKFIGERSKHERIVIIKNLFHPTDFDKEVQLILDYQQDLREECAKCGEVRKVVIYDRHPEGVAQVTMKSPEEADAVVKLINGRWFGKKKVTAEIFDGRTKYRIAETDSEITKRIDKWEKFLEENDKDDGSASKDITEKSDNVITTEVSIESSSIADSKDTIKENVEMLEKDL